MLHRVALADARFADALYDRRKRAPTRHAGYMGHPVFDEIDPRSALEGNRASTRWLLLDATAAWCGPCKIMDRTAWSDQRVVDWVREQGQAVKLDIDQHTELAQSLAIKAVPTVIAFRAGTEFDRICGKRSADKLLGWLHAIENGNTELEAARLAVGDGTNIGARLALARLYTQMDRVEEATDEYAWLWENMVGHDPSSAEVKFTFMAWDVARLANRHEPARLRFDAYGAALDDVVRDPLADPSLLREWWTINQIVGDKDATVALFDEIRDDTRWSERLRTEHNLFDALLIERGRWTDFGQLVDKPVQVFLEVWERADRAREDLPTKRPELFGEGKGAVLAGMLALSCRETAAQLRAGLVAAGRQQEADRLMTEALRLDGSAEMRRAMVEADEAARGGTPLRRDVGAAANDASRELPCSRDDETDHGQGC